MKLLGMRSRRIGEICRIELDAATRTANASTSAITRLKARLFAPVMKPHAAPIITVPNAMLLDRTPGHARSAPRNIDSSARE